MNGPRPARYDHVGWGERLFRRRRKQVVVIRFDGHEHRITPGGEIVVRAKVDQTGMRLVEGTWEFVVEVLRIEDER